MGHCHAAAWQTRRSWSSDSLDTLAPYTAPTIVSTLVDAEAIEHTFVEALQGKQRETLQTLLTAYADYSDPETDRTNVVTHCIDTGELTIKQRPHKQSPNAYQAIRNNLQQMTAVRQ